MAISLSKGQNINLSKEDPSLNNVFIGLGWETRTTFGASFDLDACAFMLSSNNKVRDDEDFIFYGQLSSKCQSVIHQGDNRTGEGDGDDEVIKVILNKIPHEIQKISITVTIYEHDIRKQNFGMVEQAFIRLVNADTNQEIARFDLTEDASSVTSMIFGELYKYNGDWKFKAVGQGFSQGLAALATNYGVNIA